MAILRTTAPVPKSMGFWGALGGPVVENDARVELRARERDGMHTRVSGDLDWWVGGNGDRFECGEATEPHLPGMPAAKTFQFVVVQEQAGVIPPDAHLQCAAPHAKVEHFTLPSLKTTQPCSGLNASDGVGGGELYWSAGQDASKGAGMWARRAARHRGARKAQ
eukprot:2650362-Rhodomonas_salina.3